MDKNYILLSRCDSELIVRSINKLFNSIADYLTLITSWHSIFSNNIFLTSNKIKKSQLSQNDHFRASWSDLQPFIIFSFKLLDYYLVKQWNWYNFTKIQLYSNGPLQNSEKMITNSDAFLFFIKNRTQGIQKFNSMTILGNCSNREHRYQGFLLTPRDWENEESPAVEKDQVQDHLRNLKMHKSLGPDEMHP